MSAMNRYALLDKTGKTRLTCLATSGPHSLRRFVRMRGGKDLPQGWIVVWRGQAKAQPAETVTAPTMGELRARIKGLDPQAEKLLVEAKEALAEAKRKQDHTDALLVKALDERDTATREARAHASTVDNLTAKLSRSNTEINRLNAILAKAQEARDAHRKALGLAEQDGTILDAIEYLQRVAERRRQGLERLREFFAAHGVVDLDETFAKFVQVDGRAREFGRLTRAEVDRLRREVETLHENVVQAKRERDLALTKRDEALAQVKDMEECPTEILGSSIFTRRGDRIHLHYNLTEQGEALTRPEFTALAAVVSAHAADLIHELTGDGEA